FAIAQLFSGAISQLISGRRTVVVGYAVFVAASLGCAAAPTLPLFLLFRLVQGVGAAFLFPILMALVGEVVAPERLGRALGWFGVTQTLGLTLGPLVAGFLEVHLGWHWFFVALGILAAVAAGGFLRLFRGEREPTREEGGVLAITLTVLREPTVVLLSLAAAALFFSMIGAYTYLAAWLKEVQGLAEDRIGVILAVAGVMGIPASAMAGQWVDRLGRKAVALVGMAGYTTALAGFWGLPYSFTGIVGLAALFGWSGAVAWTALNTLAVEVIPALRKPVASIYNALRFFGYSLAPPILGLVYGQWNVAGVYLVCELVAFGAVSSITALRLPRRRF
ncbi:MAG: MFS transporter, partial [Candidatus Methylomirabilia bacterium]